MIGSIKNFSSEVVVEMKKVSWPSKEQLKESTMVVLVVTIILTTFVWVIDQIMSFTMTGLFS